MDKGGRYSVGYRDDVERCMRKMECSGNERVCEWLKEFILIVEEGEFGRLGGEGEISIKI